MATYYLLGDVMNAHGMATAKRTLDKLLLMLYSRDVPDVPATYHYPVLVPDSQYTRQFYWFIILLITTYSAVKNRGHDKL